MRRSAAILLLTLVLGAFVAASADDGKGGKDKDGKDKDKNDYEYEREPMMKRCSLKTPWRYPTYGCPECKREGCVETKCRDGKAEVKIKLQCLFGNSIGFVALSYKVGNKEYCVNNQKQGTEINLRNQDCYKLPSHLRFIVQDKKWFNEEGQDLMPMDICYDKCTKGKPCHTCTFKDIVKVPECDNYCKPYCPPKADNCPDKDKVKDCFKFDPYHEYVKVTLKDEERCHKEKSHVAFSYYMKGKKDKYCDSYTYKGPSDKGHSFNAACKSKFTWFLEDDYYLNTKAPYSPIDDTCAKYFYAKKVCNQCGDFEKVYVPDCKEKPKDDPEDPKDYQN